MAYTNLISRTDAAALIPQRTRRTRRRSAEKRSLFSAVSVISAVKCTAVHDGNHAKGAGQWPTQT